MPGGLGIVEGSLAVVLVAYGAGRVPAVSAALAFRIVNFWLAIAVGWLSVVLIAYRLRRRGPALASGPVVGPGPVVEAGPVGADRGAGPAGGHPPARPGVS